MARVFLSLGSNIQPERHLREAVRALRTLGHDLRISTVWQTEAIGRPDQPAFYNTVAELHTGLPPLALKEALGAIEHQLGRRRTADKYAPRTIDLDILLYEDLVLDQEGLRIPDPDIARRPFLAAGICQLDDNLHLPGTGQPIRELTPDVPTGVMRSLEQYTRALRHEIAAVL